MRADDARRASSHGYGNRGAIRVKAQTYDKQGNRPPALPKPKSAMSAEFSTGMGVPKVQGGTVPKFISKTQIGKP